MSGTVGETSKQKRNARSWWDRMARTFCYRLVIPMKRSPHSPEYGARGVMIGLMWGLTPTVGIQMVFCLLTWMIAKRFFKWDFSLIVALAWTWTTNVVTLVPAYYLFFLTGEVILGRFDDLSGYGEFAATLGRALADDPSAGFWQGAWSYTKMLFEGWGLPILIGCVPWSIFGGWVGYKWSLRFIERHRQGKRRREVAEAARNQT
jgi:uncharacterized protein (DUF2062 family)